MKELNLRKKVDREDDQAVSTKENRANAIIETAKDKVCLDQSSDGPSKFQLVPGTTNTASGGADFEIFR